MFVTIYFSENYYQSENCFSLTVFFIWWEIIGNNYKFGIFGTKAAFLLFFPVLFTSRNATIVQVITKLTIYKFLKPLHGLIKYTFIIMYLIKASTMTEMGEYSNFSA